MDVDKIPVLSVRQVDVSYGNKKVLDSVSLNVEAGETYGLIGLNGAGKTTLIKTILGLRTSHAGCVFITGEDRGALERKRMVAYLPERFDPPSFLNGREFIRFSCSLYGAVPDDVAVDEMALALALASDVLDNRVHTYSKGMKQKLGLLATFMTGCPLLILDEPMSGLDPQARAHVKIVLKKLKGEGRTFFISSHILADMDEICERIGVLHGGILAYEGTPAGLKEMKSENSLERAFLNIIENEKAA